MIGAKTSEFPKSPVTDGSMSFPPLDAFNHLFSECALLKLFLASQKKPISVIEIVPIGCFQFGLFQKNCCHLDHEIMNVLAISKFVQLCQNQHFISPWPL